MNPDVARVDQIARQPGATARMRHARHTHTAYGLRVAMLFRELVSAEAIRLATRAAQ